MSKSRLASGAVSPLRRRTHTGAREALEPDNLPVTLDCIAQA
jgi:hypothetical protein